MAPVVVHIPDNKRDDIHRPCANFAPSLWGDSISSIIATDDQTMDRWLKEIEELKAEVRCMLTDRITVVEEKLSFVNKLEQLGISYLFHNEIEEELEKIFLSSSAQFETNEKDLAIVSLYFRLLRQHGFRISSKIFDDFKDENGFKDIIRTDVKGLLNLYEAAHTRIHGEDNLEESLEFASTHLELMLPNMPPSLAKQCSHALLHPLHTGVPRVEAHFFISLLDEEVESKNDSVIRLAKLDYNILQILHRKELSEFSSWWKDIISNFSYGRERTVEIYYLALCIYFEPQYSLPRVRLAKIIAMITLIDDTYDAYGTVDELKAFTEAVQRWDVSEIDQLPEYMKTLYKALLQLYDSFEEDLQKLGMSYAVAYAKERMKEITQCYYIEAKWFLQGNSPSFEDYLEIGMITITNPLLMGTSLLGTELATNEVFEWLKTNPKLVTASSIISRLANDMGTYETEKEKGQSTSGIQFYMQQYGVTKVEAMDKLMKIVENAWKDLNESCLNLKDPRLAEISIRVLNLTRCLDAGYKHHQDGFTNPRKVLKPNINVLLVDSFEI